MSNVAPFESVEHLLRQLRVNAEGEADLYGHPLEEHPDWLAANQIESLRGLLQEAADAEWPWSHEFCSRVHEAIGPLPTKGSGATGSAPEFDSGRAGSSPASPSNPDEDGPGYVGGPAHPFEG